MYMLLVLIPLAFALPLPCLIRRAQFLGARDAARTGHVLGIDPDPRYLRGITPGGEMYQLGIQDGDRGGCDAEMQCLVEASADAQAQAIEARMRAKATERVTGGTRWLTATELFSELAKRPSNVHTALSRWLEQGRIFALEKNGVRIYPRYAFDAMVEPVPFLKEALQVLEGRSPLQIAAWFESPSSNLSGKRPREVLEQDGLAVVLAAKRYVEGAVHG